MDAVAKTKEPPIPADVEAWRRVIAEQRLGEMSVEAIACGFMDIGADGDKRVREGLAKYLSDYVYRHLYAKAWTSRPNGGKDVAESAHYKIMTALLTPGSPDAVTMRTKFHMVLKSRMFDAIVDEERGGRDGDADKAREDLKKEKLRKDQKRKAKAAGKGIAVDDENAGTENDIELEPASEETDADFDGDNIEFAPVRRFDSAILDGVREIDDRIDLERILHEVEPDPRKRLAVRLLMSGVPRKSKRTHSIAKALGVDESTVRTWIGQFAEKLKKRKESQS